MKEKEEKQLYTIQNVGTNIMQNSMFMQNFFQGCCEMLNAKTGTEKDE